VLSETTGTGVEMTYLMGDCEVNSRMKVFLFKSNFTLFHSIIPYTMKGNLKMEPMQDS
jgi:hypothetical protein